MNLLAGLVLFALLLLLLPMSVRLAIAVTRRGVLGGLYIMLSLTIVPAALLLGALWVSRQGTPEEGLVIGKSETLEISDIGLTPSVAHRLTLAVASGATSAPMPSLKTHALLFEGLRRRHADLEFDVDEKMYDEVRQDSVVHFHALHLASLEFARLDAEPWWNLAPGRLERLLPVSDSGPFSTAYAQVTSVRTVSEAYEFSLFAGSGEGGARTLLKQPYDEVRFVFSTPSGAQIIALDRIDAGSAGLLTPAMSVAVRYPRDRPRQARLQQGTRSFARTNALNYWGSDILGSIAAVVLTAMTYWISKRWRSRWERLKAERARSNQTATAR